MPPTHDWARWPESHWAATTPPPAPDAPLCGPTETEVAVIGAGYAGLSAALALRARGIAVTVLEAAQPGWGASGRNGGFCCMGGAKLGHATLLRRFGRQGAREFHRFQQEAVAHVDATLTRHGIGARQGPDGEVLIAHRPRAYQALQAEVTARAELYGEALTLIPPGGMETLGMTGRGFHGAMINPVGFPLHPLEYALGLARVARGAGAVIHGATPVIGLARQGAGWRLESPGGRLDARQVLITTNGYGGDDLPPWIAGRRMPVLSAIFTTRPLSGTEQAAQGWTSRAMAFDTRELLHYFRMLPDGRFLFGMRGGLSADPQALARLHEQARRHFAAIFPAWAGVETAHFWSGHACLTGSLTPFAGPVPDAPGLWAAFGWHGNGVSTASLAGHRMAQAMAGDAPPLPAVLQTPPRRFPFPALRPLGLRMAYALYGLTDGPLPG